MIRLFISFFLVLAMSYVGFQFFGEMVAERYFQESLEYDKANDYIGVFHLLEQIHARLGNDDYQAVLASFPEVSNIPIEMFEIDSLQIAEHGMALLRQGEIYVEDADSDILFYRLQDTTAVVRAGPMRIYEELQVLSMWYNQMFFLVLAVASFLWILNLQFKLLRLNKAATALGEGDFGVRVSEKGQHKVGRLNRTFNMMADRVEKLIQGHKSLTNAVAHELRTPVSRIRFQLDMLYQEKDKQQRNDYMYGMSDDLNELTDMVDELLTYARFDREAPAIHMQNHSLHQSILNVIDARHFQSEMAMFYDDSWFLADNTLRDLPFEPNHLERAIGNLVSNAQKYARGKIQIQVLRDPHNCTIYVDDDGPGIPEKDRENIFEPFKRLDDSRTRATGGYGLGLAIVKQIADWHGGKVQIEKAPIGGARFVFRWPLGEQLG